MTLRPSGLATERPPLAGQDFAEECDINVLMAYGRCLRPALYSSLRSSPSHPTGVSALRVTIAIANARFARKQWGVRSSRRDDQTTEEGEEGEESKIKRTGVRELADDQRSRNLCLHT